MEHEVIDRILTNIILLIRNYFLINIYTASIHTQEFMKFIDYSGSGHNGLCSRQAAADYLRFNIGC